MGFTFLLHREDARPETHMLEDWPPLLEAAVPGLRVVLARDEEALRAHLPDADAAFGWIGPELFPLATRLRWLASPQANPHPSFYHDALIESDVTVTNFRGIFNDHIGTHIMAFVLAFSRGLPTYHGHQLRREWQKGAPTLHLPESTAVIVGLGGIGTEAARLCAAFGMRVIGVDGRTDSPPPGVAELHPPEDLHEVAGQGDFLIVTVPETPQTQGLFNAALFRAMKRGAYFINIGRGATTVLTDLAHALREGQLAGAGLDVFQQEPLPADHPLWEAPGALLTPHVAADGPYLDDRRFEIITENCRRFDAGQPLLNVVDKAQWH